ncbi:MAG: biotin--[acetyl-CoA-carboxylase] ligase [Clostridia bacterium]
MNLFMRETILEILIGSKDQYISGEEISSRVGVTRAAVWKTINGLKEDGYIIKASPRKGYCLIEMPDRLEPSIVREGLKTRTLGKHIYYYRQIDSTNKKAKELAIKGKPNGTLIIAEEQTKGRGRLGREWLSPFGTGIWMSILLRPDIHPWDAPRMTLLSAAAVARSIEGVTKLKTGIKWPNDIIVGQKKVCGILTEMNGELDQLHWIVIGIGINVNGEQKDFPEELHGTASSLKIELGRPVDRAMLLRRICTEMESYLDEFLKSRDFSPVIQECRRRSVTIGKMVRVTGSHDDWVGKAEDIDLDGSLLVRRADGTLERVLSGDVSVRGIAGYI